MLPPNVVRICSRSLFAISNRSAWQSYGFLLLFAMATTGCRSPFGPRSNPEPSFDRLLELENSSTSLNSPAPASSSFAQQQVSQRRPGAQGGNTAASRFADQDELVEPTALANRAASRRFSDMDEQVVDGSDTELKLLRQTQLALSNAHELAPNPADVAAVPTDGDKAARKKINTRNSDDEIVIRMSDDSSDEVEETVHVEKLVDNRKPKSQNSSTKQKLANDAAVQTASYSSSGPDRAEHLERVEKFDRAGQSSHMPQSESIDAPESQTWQQHLREALEQLDNSSSETLTSPQEKIRQAMIARLIALSLNDREAMLESIEGLQTHEQDYVNHQLSAIFDAIDPEANPVSSRKWSLVMLNQRKANTHLASLSNLEINNIAFCTEVIDFGVTTSFPVNRFSADQEVLLYLELDNFVSEKAKDGKGYETQLQGSYEIVDSNGRRIADQLLPADSHVCKNIRRDYFIAYRVYMPPKIAAGNYTLKLTIEDLKGRKFGQSDIQFQIQQ